MAKFKYTAKKDLDNVIEGVVEAQNEKDALDKIFSQGLTPLNVELDETSFSKKEDRSKEKRRFRVRFLQKINFNHVLVFTQKLTTLTRAKVELMASLKILHAQTDHSAFKSLLSEIYASVKDGKTFSESLGKFPKVFPPLFINIIKSGEDSGSLESALNQIGQFFSRQEDLKRKITLALAYPALLVVMGLASIFILINFVIPRLAPVFDNIGQELPIFTKIVLSISNFSHQNSIFILGGMFSISILIYLKRDSAFFQILGNKMKTRVPVVKRLVKDQELVQFSQSLALLLESGIPALRTLEVAIPMVENKILQQQLKEVQRQVAAGQSLAKSMKAFSSLPDFFVKMVEVGEESGRLAEVLRDISSSYIQEVERDTALIGSLLEPILIVILGSVLGGLVLSILIPIFQITQMVQ